MADGDVTVVDTYDEERDAIRAMHEAAERIRSGRRADRFGVFVEKRAGVWYLCLARRAATT